MGYPLNKCCSSDPDGSLPVGLVICKPTLKHGSTFCHPCRDLYMAEILVSESRQFVDIESATCQSHNLSRFNFLLIPILIRQDHLMGRPRNVESKCICSIGTIRDGIPAGAPDYEMFNDYEDMVICFRGLPMIRSSRMRVIMARILPLRRSCRNE
jgi:hypothetical protein